MAIVATDSLTVPSASHSHLWCWSDMGASSSNMQCPEEALPYMLYLKFECISKASINGVVTAQGIIIMIVTLQPRRSASG